MTDANPLEPYDAVLLASFGGPEKPDEIMPFLRRVTAGRGIPDERLAEVAHHYEELGGRSPINDQNRALIAALRAELDRRDITTPILWGNRNSEPFLTDVLREAYDGGMRNVVALTTSAYSSYSSCRQYRENLAEALDELRRAARTLGPDLPTVSTVFVGGRYAPVAITGSGKAFRSSLPTGVSGNLSITVIDCGTM